MASYYPIIYLRGFAYPQDEIDAVSDDPSNGFNLGSVHARQSPGNAVLKLPFPGPLVRLMTDHGYQDAIRGEFGGAAGAPDPRRTIWIYRYYEDYATTFGDSAKKKSGQPLIRQTADNLKKFIDQVRAQAYGGTGAEVQPKKQSDYGPVILVAHSMGGLICRSLIQQVLAEAEAKQYVAKVVTYGTPHGGIQVAGREWRFTARMQGLGNFTHKRMTEFLRPPSGAQKKKGFDVQRLENFAPENFLCIVGTNHADYDVARGYARKYVGGPASDGLVKINNAWVRDAPRVYINRSHSGRYGMVNSDDGYQAMRRFLFGNLRATLQLINGRPIGRKDGSEGFFMDLRCLIGPAGVQVNDQNYDNLSAVKLEPADAESSPTATETEDTLFVFHLLDQDETADGFRLTVAFRLRHDRYPRPVNETSILELMEYIFDQSVVIQVTRGEGDWGVTYRWQARQEEIAKQDEAGHYTIDIPPGYLESGWPKDRHLRLKIEEWNTTEEPRAESSIAAPEVEKGRLPLEQWMLLRRVAQHRSGKEKEEIVDLMRKGLPLTGKQLFEVSWEAKHGSPPTTADLASTSKNITVKPPLKISKSRKPTETKPD